MPTSKALRLSGLAKELDALAAASSSTLVVYEYTATAGQTVFSGPDNNGLTLNYIGPNSLIFDNGSLLQKTVDFATTSSSVLTLTNGAVEGSLISVYAFGTFAVANVYTKAEDDARFVNKADVIDVAHGGTGNSTGTATKLSPAAIKGPVSQLGGVPTGALMEYGTNANGEFWKYACGMMICTRSENVTKTLNAALGNIFYDAAPMGAAAMPATFISVPRVTVNIVTTSTSTAWIGGLGAQSVSAWSGFYFLECLSRPTASYNIHYIAIGRWF